MELRKPSTTTNINMAAFKLLLLELILYALVKAEQPEGYLGCFDEKSLINEIPISNNVNYTGNTCKAECNLHRKRYAGTKHGHLCSCGDDFQNAVNSTGCDWICGEKPTEICGSSNTISLYDTWMCITDICKNRATCKNIDADHYICICSDGWTGIFCDERVNSATSHSTQYLFSSTSSFLSTRITSTKSSTTMTISALVTTTEQPTTQSSWFTGSVDKTVLISVHGPTTANNPRLIENLSSTNSEPHTTAYIAVSVTIIIVVVVGVIIFVIIRRKRQRMKQDNSAIYNSSNGHTRGFSVVNNLKYNDHDIVQLDTTTYQKETAENTTSEKSGLTFEEISDQYITIDTPYHTTDTPFHSVSVIHTEIPVDEDGYGHTKSTTNVVFDPTYSHTTDLQTKHTSENTYSHINKVAKKTTSEPNINHTNEIYNTLNNNGTTGTPKPEAKSTETDDTYNTVNKNGKTISRCDNNTSSSLNEPNYDHIESKDL